MARILETAEQFRERVNNKSRFKNRSRNHYDTSGNLIGGYDESGKAFGTKTNKNRAPGAIPAMATQPVQQPDQAQREATQPVQRPTGPVTTPATGNLLNQRQSLFRRMQTMKPNEVEAFRKEAAGLGVQEDGWERAFRTLDRRQAEKRTVDRWKAPLPNTPPPILPVPAAMPTAGAKPKDTMQPGTSSIVQGPPSPMRDTITPGASSIVQGPPAPNAVAQASPQATPSKFRNNPRPAGLSQTETANGYKSVAKGEPAPAGMELVGMRGAPGQAAAQVYAPIKQVYGQSATGAGTVALNAVKNATGIGTPKAVQTPDTIRKDYQDKMQPSPQASAPPATVAPAESKFRQGKAASPDPMGRYSPAIYDRTKEAFATGNRRVAAETTVRQGGSDAMTQNQRQEFPKMYGDTKVFEQAGMTTRPTMPMSPATAMQPQVNKSRFARVRR